MIGKLPKWRRAAMAVSVCGITCWASSTAYGLTSERSYEQVSPSYKGGFGATHIEAVAEDGDSIAYFSPGVFAEAPSGLTGGLDDLPSYRAKWTLSGWTTSAFMPPATIMPSLQSSDVTPTLESAVTFGYPSPNAAAGNYEQLKGEFLLHSALEPDTTLGWRSIGVPLEALSGHTVVVALRGAASDFCKFVFENDSQEDPLTEEEMGTKGQLYEDTSGCNGESAQLRLIGLNNQDGIINTSCPDDFGVEGYANGLQSGDLKNSFNALSADGNEIFFTSCVEGKNPDSHYQMFVRLGGARTLEVSKGLSEKESCGAEIPCPEATSRAPAAFAGASESGSHVFFMTAAPLTGDKEDTSLNLFMATIGCPKTEQSCQPAKREVTSLAQVSHDPNEGGVANVQGTLRVAPDGSRAYFVAGGDLLGRPEHEALESEHRPLPGVGADNLYVYRAANQGEIKFIGRLCSGHELSGQISDADCPGNGSDVPLWKGGEAETQTAGVDGRYLIFSSYAQLTSTDIDAASDIYRYDAANDVLVRVSGGENGADTDGNNSMFEASILRGYRSPLSLRDQHEMDRRAISEDGSRVVFMSAEPLSPKASNGLVNLYEWHENEQGSGNVSLISGGTSETPVEDGVISPDGDNVFFVTTQSLARGDTDGESDIYDARVGEAFPEQPAAFAECEGEECHSALSAPAPIVIPGSISQEPGGGAQPSSPNAKPKTANVHRKPKKKARTKRKVRRKKTKRNSKKVSSRSSVSRRARGSDIDERAAWR